jgi:hypothetical protein
MAIVNMGIVSFRCVEVFIINQSFDKIQWMQDYHFGCEIEMKKSKGLKIRKVWVIKPKSRIKVDSKRIILAKIRKQEQKEQVND